MIIKTEQFDHQRETYLLCRDREYFAVFWEMGLGKTKLALDVASYLYSKGRIQQLIIFAPKSVYRNWLTDEIPTHLGAPHATLAYPGHDIRAQVGKDLWLDNRRPLSRLRVLAMSLESLRTAHGFEFAVKAATVFRTMVVVDESTAIKTPSAKQTKNVKKVGKKSCYRYILTGTPAAQSPFDVHSQIQFLDPHFWGKHGVKTLGAFKQEYGIFDLIWCAGGKQRPVVSGYRRIDNLRKIIAPISSRLLKEDSTINLPPKLYKRYSFDMTPEQRRVYDELKKSYAVSLSGGEYVEAPLSITRLLRLQQIAAGFVGSYESYDAMFEDDSISITPIMPAKDNPRLRLLATILAECDHKVIVWCKFVPEVELICSALPDTEQYHGSMSVKARERAIARFKDPDNNRSRILVCSIKAMAYGVTVVIAQTAIYWSNSHSLEKRLQSEDRIHRIGQKHNVLIIDLVANSSVDNEVVTALRNKFDIAAQTTGDRVRNWISE